MKRNGIYWTNGFLYSISFHLISLPMSLLFLGCLHNKELPDRMKGKIYDNHGKAMKDKIELFSQYKFALVFENHNVEDYVTEKLMCALQAGTIPGTNRSVRF